ncbi:DUF222 domain-containing protein [Actinomycetospora endophytica]|uniref:DUF222 domain-containing protein n=1 Tax=Actinomycetospora endophytica TaxID=2291215 RepID=A0ABS8P4Z3_9PSEU|nr:HNH endonuclease signature motif containing protein [Actinomycetospora endophytica]MCD2193321.1 DUF222 domain-containing protein [Actinomycetospora endophytica]
MVGDVVESGAEEPGLDWGCPPEERDAGVPPECAVFPEALPDWMLRAMDPAEAPGQWTEAGLAAAFRAENHVTWRRWRWIWEAWRAAADTTERVAQRSRPGKVPAAVLGWSEQLGAARIEFARQILVRLPALGEAMREGWLEQDKASIFVSTVADLDDAQARLVVERLLGRAPTLTHAQLRARVEATAAAVDPGWAEARKAAAIARRRVSLRVLPSGSAELSGVDLPPEPAQDAYDRIVALGDVVHDRLRAAGRDAGHGVIRSEVLLVLTGPDGAGLWDDDVIELVLARFTDPGTGPDGGPEPGPDGGPAPGTPDGGPGPEGGDAAPDEGPGGDRSGGDPLDDGTDARLGDDSDAAAEDGDRPDAAPDPGEPAPDGRPPDDDAGSGGSDDPCPAHENDLDDAAPVDGAGGSAPRAVPFRARTAIRLGLRTVLGLDRRPGEIPGQGTVCCSTARQLAWDRTDTTWRVHLYDDHGHLEYLLTVRPPSCGPPGAGGRRRRHVVELTAHSGEVDDLAAGIGLDGVGVGELIGADAITLLDRTVRALTAARARPPEEHPAVTTADAHRRRPGAELARWVVARDRTCRGIGCNHQAVGADLDHTLAWDDGGLSTADDLGPLCQGDHLFKHDPDSGWTVTQPEAGVFVWTSPTGTRHTRIPEPYDPLPDPLVPTDGSPHTLPAETWAPAPGTRDPFTPKRNRHGYITTAAFKTAGAMAARHRHHQGKPPSRYDHDPDF